MTTKIISNGSRWAGEGPATIGELLDVLSKHTLDPTFEEFGNFITLDPVAASDGKPIYPAGTTSFWGNFSGLSHCFNIATDDPELVASLTAAIRANQATKEYADTKQAIAERNASAIARREARYREERADALRRLRAMTR